jgi:hypothetical protein
MEGRGNSELDAFRPHPIIIIQTIDREVVDPEAEAGRFGRSLLDNWQRRTLPGSITTFIPSSLTEKFSSLIASSGVCIGMTATGTMRSENSRNKSA